MSDFLTFYEYLTQRFPLHLEITQNKITDWCIRITKRGGARDHQGVVCDGRDEVLVSEQHGDMEYVFTRAHVALKDWMMEYEGGY